MSALIHEGKYVGIPTAAVLAETSKGDPQVAIAFDLPEVETSLTYFGFFTEKTERRTIETLRYCGWTGNDITDLSSVGSDPSVRVELVVEVDEYNGETRNKIAWVNRPGGIALTKPLDVAKKAQLKARLAGLVVDVTKSTGANAAFHASADAPAPKPQNGNGARPPVDTSREPEWMREELPPPMDDCPI